MTDVPIIFSAPMVQALPEGRKTMTRRLAWRAPNKPSTWQKVKAGDRLWVRETVWINTGDIGAGDFRYRADNPPGVYPWTPAIHMPRRASRLTLEVTATKIEPLQKITEADAIAEGATPLHGHGPEPHVIGFMRLWETLHGEAAWAVNPEVIALTFKVHKQNIDSLPPSEPQGSPPERR